MLSNLFEEFSTVLNSNNHHTTEDLYSSDDWYNFISELIERRIKIKQFNEKDPKGFGAIHKDGYWHIVPFRKFVVFFESIEWNTQKANNITSHIIFELENEREMHSNDF